MEKKDSMALLEECIRMTDSLSSQQVIALRKAKGIDHNNYPSSKYEDKYLKVLMPWECIGLTEQPIVEPIEAPVVRTWSSKVYNAFVFWKSDYKTKTTSDSLNLVVS